MKRLLHFSGLAVALTLAAAGCVDKADETATVTGKVTFPDGKPLPGGRIDFRVGGTGNLVSGQVQPDGTYEALKVPPGSYKVSIDNSSLKGAGAAAPPGTAPMPSSPETAGQKYVPLHAKFFSPETSGLSTTVAGKAHTYDIVLK